MAMTAQRGQALVEALVVMGVLAGGWLAAAWLGRLRDIDLQALHASRHQAFAHAHQGVAAPAMMPADSYFTGAGQHWASRHDASVLAGVGARWLQAAQAPHRQLGDSVAAGPAIRRELRLGDEAVRIAEVGLATAGVQGVEGGLRDFDRRALRWVRHTAILRGEGAAPGDAQVQAVLAGAGTLWADAAGHSAGLGRSVDARMRPVDAPWGRAGLQDDWLTPWAGMLPARHLRIGEQP